MTIPDKVRAILHNGKPVAAELTASQPDHRSFLMVIPQIPDPRENPDAWIPGELAFYPDQGGLIRLKKLKDTSFIRG